MDTILVRKGQTFIAHDKSYVFKSDTILILPSSLKYEIKPSKSEAFFNKLAQNADRNLLTRELHNIIINNRSKTRINDTLKTSASILPYIYNTGKQIKRIQIRQLDVFGPTIDDTGRVAQSWIEQTGNKLHFKTKEYLIRNSLLFKEGDFVDPVVLADNERVLRNLSYLEDARIIVNSIDNETADVLVLVKDVWPTAFNISVDNVYSGQFEVWNRNILGFGQEFQSNLLWNTHKAPTTGTENYYTINNISRTFISGKIFYNNSFQNESYGLQLQRSFFTPNIKYAGGFTLSNTHSQDLFKIDTSNIYYPVSYNTFNLWAGRSFLIHRSGFAKTRHNLTFTAGVNRNQFFERPEISKFSYYDYQNKTLLLGSISYSRHSYFKSNFIYNFGRTEDIPVGSGVGVTLGKEMNEFFNRSYAAVNLSAGTFAGNWGYFYSSFNIGSFFLNTGKIEQGALVAQFNYFSPLVILKNFRFRQFINANYTAGKNRFSNEHLLINEHYGLSGFMNDSVYGTKRFNMHWETDCFTPWTLYDFRFVLFLFADHSWLVNDRERIFAKLPYTAFGIGVRIRNERLVFNTIQIGLTFYPNIPSGSKTRTLEISGEPLLNPPNFLPTAPSLITYK